MLKAILLIFTGALICSMAVQIFFLMPNVMDESARIWSKSFRVRSRRSAYVIF